MFTASGRNSEALPPLRMISRTMVDATEVYFGSPVKKDGFDIFVECAVGIGDGLFVFKIAYITDTAENKMAPMVLQ
jgi:hypothetical protein